MERLTRFYISFSLTLTLFLNLIVVFTHPQQQTQLQLGLNRHVSIPSVNSQALQKAEKYKQLHRNAKSVVNTTYDESKNWAGYIIGDGSDPGFKGVEANWNAPCKSGSVNSQIGYSSWVGIGGNFSGDQLEQAGILLQSDGTYRMFWEYVWSATSDPPYIDSGDVVHCGDSMTAWVYFGSSYCSNGGFYAHVQDNTTGGHLGSTCLTESHGLGHKSAEWIDERPTNSGSGCVQQLADFNYTQWSNVLAQPNSTGASYQNPNNFVNHQELMYSYPSSGATFLSAPDGLQVNSDNTFTGRWYNYGTYCAWLG